MASESTSKVAITYQKTKYHPSADEIIGRKPPL
jgi:hypothetical protein